MKILITGGAGFIGSHLADKLVAEGHEITVVDDFSTGRYSNVAHLEGRKDFRLIVDTVLNAKLMEELIRDSDRVYHMASAVGVRLIMEQPVQTIETIFRGTDIVLGFCSRYRTRVLIPSTSEVYGKGTSVPFREDDDIQKAANHQAKYENSTDIKREVSGKQINQIIHDFKLLTLSYFLNCTIKYLHEWR